LTIDIDMKHPKESGKRVVLESDLEIDRDDDFKTL
jgi:hypothetical protein